MDGHRRSEIQIESDVPLPSRKPAKYPFGKMKIGESFFAAVDPKLLTNAAGGYGRSHNMKFAVRTVEGGARCWRIA